jgi:hypothetical protein
VKTDQLTYTHKPGTWNLAMMLQNPHFYEPFWDAISVFLLTPGPDLALEGRGKQHIQEI